jgi:hypothetical protein
LSVTDVVAARLAQGRLAVEHTQRYVCAAQRRGYLHPELTAHDAAVLDRYDSEAGLDLARLDDDCAGLRAVAEAAEEALRVQRAQLGALAAAWTGPGADAATQFLQQHCAAGAGVAATVRAGAAGCAALADTLWRLIDDKVATTIGIDERSCAQRPTWLAAAQAVTTGGQSAADEIDEIDEIVEQEITPYVDNDIRIDWLTAMHSAQGAVAAAYDAALAAVTPGGAVVFSIPGELGPGYRPPAWPGPVSPAAAAPAAAAGPAVSAGPAASAPAPPADPAPFAVSPSLPTDPAPPMAAPLGDPVPAPLGDSAVPAEAGLPGGLGLPSGAGGLGGLIPRLAEAIGALLGSPDDGLVDPELDEPFADEALNEPFDESVDEEPDADLPDDEEPDDPELVTDPEPVDEKADQQPEPDEPADESAADAPSEAAVAAPAEEQVVAAPEEPEPQDDPVASTPCEIAADELPQAGQ